MDKKIQNDDENLIARSLLMQFENLLIMDRKDEIGFMTKCNLTTIQ